MSVFSTTEANKLHNIQINLEKSIKSVLERLKKYSDCDVCEYSAELLRTRQAEWQSFQTKIKDIWEPLRSKIKTIQDKALSDITDFKQFKKEMIVIQENIQNLKSETKMKIELLEKEESDMSQDLDNFNEKLLQWLEPIKVNTYCNANLHKPKIGGKNKHQCREAKEFMDFVHMSGGHENGWNIEDHRLFIKFRQKYKNIDAVAQHLHEALPDITITEIKCHEEWYMKYLNLQKKKKDAIKAWQIEKNKKSSLNFPNTPSHTKTVPEVESGVNIQEKLVRWKTEKEEKMKAASEIEFCKEQKRKESEELRKKRNEELKKIVQEWKQTKEIEEKRELLAKKSIEEYDKRRRAIEANRMIKQFQSLDDIYILKMRQQKKREVTAQIRSKSSYLAKRDPERLLKPTIQWINRVHDETKNSTESVIPLKHLPKLRIPEWRKNLD